MNKIPLLVLSSAAALAVVGCGPDLANYTPGPTPAPEPAISKQADSFKPGSPAGVETNPPAGPLWAQLVTSRAFSARPDPFALHPKERSYEVRQSTERIFGSLGGFDVRFTPEEEKVVVPEVEPQPYRRLAGVIVGDSVLALIDMGDGQLKLIRPGQEIDGWRVVSIDSDKAILRRSGNKLPREVTVQLMGANPTSQPGGSGGGRSGGGAAGAPGGAPGGGGRPGGPQQGGAGGGAGGAG